MATLSARAVRKEFGGVPILKGIDLDVADGEFLTLVGPSGCGKSTLLRLIAGLDEISGGEIRIGGSRVNEVAPKDRDIAMVFQSYALYPHMRVAENMGFALEMQNLGKAAIAERVGAAADILGLRPLLARYPRQLSGGQRQRVAMGRAIVRNPKVFLFDEPLSNLDAKLRVAMRAEIKELHQRLGTTIIYVTHDQIEAMTMADRIVVMREGCVEQIGSPLDLYDRPANAFVATFIGSPAMNLVRGHVAIHDGAARFEVAGGQVLALPAGFAGHGPFPRAADFGIRPEDIDFADEGLAARVVVVEPTGSETHVLTRLEGADALVMVVSRDRVALRPDERIRLKPRLERSHLFDAGDGARIRAEAEPARGVHMEQGA